MTRTRVSAGALSVLLTFSVVLAGISVSACNTAQPDDERIVSLSPSTTELLYELGLGPDIVAVDEQSSFPAKAPRKDGLSGFQPDAEVILKHSPTVVILNSDVPDVGGGPISQKLQAQRVDVVFDQTPKNLDGLYAGIASLGRQFDREKEATALIERLRNSLAEIKGSVPADRQGRRYYHEVDPTFYTATSETFIGSIYELFDLRNIADPLDQGGTGFPQLTEQNVAEADPEFIFLADTKCCDQTPEKIFAKPEWQQVSAVVNRKVFGLDDDVASRWGPRIIELAQAIAGALQA